MVKVTVTTEEGVYVYEFDETPTEKQLTKAIDHIGGRPNDRS